MLRHFSAIHGLRFGLAQGQHFIKSIEGGLSIRQRLIGGVRFGQRKLQRRRLAGRQIEVVLEHPHVARAAIGQRLLFDERQIELRFSSVLILSDLPVLRGLLGQQDQM